MKEKISITIEKKLLRNIDSIIDNIYVRNRSQAIENLIQKVIGEEKMAVILAGGPEENLKLKDNEFRIFAKRNGKSVIGAALIKLRKNNFKNIYLIARSNILIKAFGLLGNGSSYGISLNYIEEKNSKGSFETLKLVKGKINTNFLVVYDDIIFDKINIEKLWESHIISRAETTLTLTTSAEPSKKGNAVLQGNKILEFKQKPKKSDNYIVFSPIFVMEPEVLERHGKSLEHDLFPELAGKGLLGGHFSPEKETHVHE